MTDVHRPIGISCVHYTPIGDITMDGDNNSFQTLQHFCLREPTTIAYFASCG